MGAGRIGWSHLPFAGICFSNLRHRILEGFSAGQISRNHPMSPPEIGDLHNLHAPRYTAPNLSRRWESSLSKVCDMLC